MITAAQYKAAYDAAKKIFNEGKPVRSRMCRRWIIYHFKNEEVYFKFCELLREMKDAGYKQWSIQGAMEVARWQCRLDVDRTEKFKFPNEYGAYYARIIMMENPDLYGFMRVSKSEADHELGWNHFKMAMVRAEKDNRLPPAKPVVKAAYPSSAMETA